MDDLSEQTQIFLKGIIVENRNAASPSMLTYTVPEAATVLRLSRAKVYRLIEREGLPTVRFGRAVRVPIDALHTWLNARIE